MLIALIAGGVVILLHFVAEVERGKTPFFDVYEIFDGNLYPLEMHILDC
jgi:hypothetical protein